MIDYLYFMRIYYFLIALVFYNPVMAQHQNEAFKNLGNFYIVKLASAPFPHPDRANGHIYQDPAALDRRARSRCRPGGRSSVRGSSGRGATPGPVLIDVSREPPMPLQTGR